MFYGIRDTIARPILTQVIFLSVIFCLGAKKNETSLTLPIFYVHNTSVGRACAEAAAPMRVCLIFMGRLSRNTHGWMKEKNNYYKYNIHAHV